MTIADALKNKKMSMYRLAKQSEVPYTTINDLCSGTVEIQKCTAGTLDRVASYLGVTVEDILEAECEFSRMSSFEHFKSDTCHRVKEMGDLDYIEFLLETDEIRTMYRRRWHPEAFYLLGMLDYLSNENELPLCTRYDDLRAQKLRKPIYPADVLLTCKVMKSDKPIQEAEKDAIPEFRRFNIIESEIRNVI